MIYTAAWAALLAIYTAAFVANDVPIDLALRNAVANLLPDALLGLAVLRLPALLRWDARRGRFFAAHVSSIALFLIGSALGWIGLVTADRMIFGGHEEELNLRILPWRALYDVLIYCTLAGVAYARDNAERTAKAEGLRARAALETMRSQLNPHFILNTFHALVGLVRREPATAEAALERLGDMLRYSLRVQRDGIDEVPLREELALVEGYLELERLRLGERLRSSIEAPPESLDCLVPTFAIQILVENAVRHSIAPRAAGGKVEVRIEERGPILQVSVKDEGEAPAGEREEGAGIGLKLLVERLAALYGGAAKLSVRSVDSGTHAGLEFPAHR